MPESDAPNPLVPALWELYDAVAARPDQTVYRIAEQSVLIWTHVLDGKAFVQPRLNVSGYVPSAFHFGMELKGENRLDVAARHARPVSAPGASGAAGDAKPGGDPGGEEGARRYTDALEKRLDALGDALERFFGHKGYRNSTDQCDQMMVELALASRFLGVRCVEAERALGDGSSGYRGEPVDLFTGTGRGGLLFETRFQRFFWEPFLNETIVAWQQNSLPDYVRALTRLRDALAAPAAIRRSLPHQAGYPCRALGRPRHKVLEMHPEARPLRGKSMFDVRLGQLLRRTESQSQAPLRIVLELEREVRHFIHMVHTGRLTVATEPSFQEVGRQALSLIRSRPAVHPFLLDPVEFFKKAVLFYNGTYTIAGGGLDSMYLQMRQLERYFRFEHWVTARGVRAPLEACLIGWEENRWDAFTAGVLRVAEIIRDNAAA